MVLTTDGPRDNLLRPSCFNLAEHFIEQFACSTHAILVAPTAPDRLLPLAVEAHLAAAVAVPTHDESHAGAARESATAPGAGP